MYRKSGSLDGHSQDNNIQAQVDHLHETLARCAAEAYSTMEKKSYHFPAKPWWNSDLTSARKILQQTFNQWRTDEFTKDPSSLSYNRYLFARKRFRSLVKHAKHQSTVDHFINVEKLKNIKPKSYWKQIQKLKGSSQKQYTINGKTDSSDISREFKDHFNRILNTPRVDGFDNTLSNQELRRLLDSLDTNNSNFYVTESDMTTVLNKLKSGKARDPFSLKSEHFISATSPTFITHLTRLANNIFQSEELPPCLSSSIIIPLAKSYKKSLKDPNNYRGISLIPIITKILELIIIEKCPSLKSNNTSQFGFTANSSTLHAEAILLDTVQYYNSQKSPVYICSLDAEKAFDCCNWLSLFQKLSQKDIPNIVMAFLIKLYLNGSALIHYATHNSETFYLSQGVRQGSVLSPYLYNVYTEDLLESIKQLKVGTFLPNDFHSAIIVYADDIILLSPCLSQLQMMLSHCESFGQENGIKFCHSKSKTKTQFIISGTSDIPNPTLTLNNLTVLPQQDLTHLGFCWNLKKDKLYLNAHRDYRLSEL